MTRQRRRPAARSTRCRSWTLNDPPRDLRLGPLAQHLVYGAPGWHLTCDLERGHASDHRHGKTAWPRAGAEQVIEPMPGPAALRLVRPHA